MANLTKIILIVLINTLFFVPSLSANTSVLCLQKFLKKTVFDPGSLDGVWGDKTESSINSLLDQAGMLKPNQKISMLEAEEVCNLLHSSKRDELLESGKFKVFRIETD
ncbi:MAG: hypothetical protein HOD94_02455 [Rhodobacteraceae bacterium]|nr:hypothetical protein [Paracoccaceae bacterium]